jgi:hypothetical protein
MIMPFPSSLGVEFLAVTRGMQVQLYLLSGLVVARAIL